LQAAEARVEEFSVEKHRALDVTNITDLESCA
jgi:hypothetical protein